MNDLSINKISELTNKTIKYIRREVAKGSLKSYKKGNRSFITEKNFLIWQSNNKERKKISRTSSKNNYLSSNEMINWIDIKNEMLSTNGWKYNDQIINFNFIDLFSGAGGLSCGLVMAGMMPVGSVEILPYAVDTYKNNFSKIKRFNENIATKDIREKTVKDELISNVKGKHIHLIAGGFPCQGFSMAGNRIITDPRNSLYIEMLEIVKMINPEYVLMENVEGLRSMLNGEIEKKIISDYNKIGYKINVALLNAVDYGVAQTRKRVIFIGNRIGAKNYHPEPTHQKNEYQTVGDVLKKYLDMPEDKKINHIFAKTSSTMQERIQKLEVGKSLYSNYSDAWKKVDWNKPSCTVKENHGGVNIHPILNRVMTPRELATLQSFPEDFVFCGAKKWQLVQIGNAVPCLLAKAIGLSILKSFNEWKEKNE